jgi:hypothetical protein
MSTISGSSIPSTFPQFCSERCPKEIRELIWKFAIAAVGPRIVEIKYKLHGKDPEERMTLDEGVGEVACERISSRNVISRAPIPGFLHLCRGSRAVALKRWKLSFGGKDARKNPKIFFDARTDVLHFRTPISFSMFACNLREERDVVAYISFGSTTFGAWDKKHITFVAGKIFRKAAKMWIVDVFDDKSEKGDNNGVLMKTIRKRILYERSDERVKIFPCHATTLGSILSAPDLDLRWEEYCRVIWSAIPPGEAGTT